MAEVNLFAPPTSEELKSTQVTTLEKDLFAPPTEDELFAPPTEAELAPPVSALEAAGRGAIQSVAFDFADELEAAVRSLAPGETYEDAVQKVRAKYKAAQEQQKAAYLGGALAGGVASGFLPVVGPLTTLAKGAGIGKAVAQGAAMGAVSGLGQAEDITNIPDVAKEVATGAAFGGAGAGVLGAGGKVIGAIAKKVMAPVPPAMRNVAEEVEKIVAPNRELWNRQADDLYRVAKEGGELTPELQQEAKEFARQVGEPTKNAIDVVRDYASRSSPEDFRLKVERYKAIDATEARLKEIAVDEPGVATSLRSFLTAGIDFSSVARMTDKKLGTNLSQILLDSTEAINRYQTELRDFLVKKKPVSIAYEKLNDADKLELRDALTGAGEYTKLNDKGKLVSLSEKEILDKIPERLKEQYQGWRTIFDESRDRANELLGADVITRRQNYLPDQMLDMPRAILAIEKEVKRAAELMNQKAKGSFDMDAWKRFEAGQIDTLPTNASINEIAKAGHPLHNLYRAANYLTGEAPESTKDLMRIIKQSLTPGGDVYTSEIKASALMQRSGLMPDFLKEKDIRVLANKWGQQTYRYAYMRNNLADLEQQASYLKSIGAKDEAEKVQRLHDEYLGAARGVADLTRKGKLYFQTKAFRAAENATNPVTKELYQWLGEAPDMFQDMVLNVYPNFLGASPRAAVQNLTGGLYMLVPELGNIYGTKAVLPAYLRAIKGIASKGYVEKLVEEGFMPPQWSTELKEAIRTSRPQGRIGRNVDKAAEVVMKLFEWSELLNRAVAYETGSIVARDAMKGGKAALKYLDTMPTGVKRPIMKALETNNLTQADKLITRYLADRTLFSYNRITSSELSRMVGPLFSMFTKYPSAIAGKVAEEYSSRGFVGGTGELARFVTAPLLVGVAINSLFEPGSKAEEMLFGLPKDEDTWARGVALSSPVFSVKSILEGRMFTPPLVGAAKETSLGLFELLEGDPDRLGRAIRNAARAFVPGGAQAIVNLAEQVTGEDIPVLGKEE